jgi:hypothetical protein
MLNKSVAFRIICALIQPSIFGEMQQIQKLNTKNCWDIWIEFIAAARKRSLFNVTSCDIFVCALCRDTIDSKVKVKIKVKVKLTL